MVRVIINADDYGINAEATQAITDCMLRNWVTNTTLMVTMPSCEEAVKQAREHNLLDRIGLHVNLREGLPMTERIRSCREFCDTNGRFNSAFAEGGQYAWLRVFAPLRKSAIEALRIEVEAQFEKYLDLGLPVKHFDGHHHYHIVPRVIPTIFEIARHYGFKSVRRPLNTALKPKWSSKIYRQFDSAIRMSLISAYGFKTTDYAGGIADVRECFAKKGFKTGSTLDLMVHPVYMTNGKRDLSGEIIDSWQKPMAETIDFITQHSNVFQLISYKDIQQ